MRVQPLTVRYIGHNVKLKRDTPPIILRAPCNLIRMRTQHIFIEP